MVPINWLSNGPKLFNFERPYSFGLQLENMHLRNSRFSEELILNIYKFALPTRIIINASNVATGGVLEQKHEDNYWHPATYHSSLMSKEERNYPIYDREMLGLICALEDW